MYIFVFTERSKRRLRKLPFQTQKRIIRKLEFYQKQKNPLDSASHLTNYDIGMYRFRIGDYRIICDLEENIIIILDIGHRKDIYK